MEAARLATIVAAVDRQRDAVQGETVDPWRQL